MKCHSLNYFLILIICTVLACSGNNEEVVNQPPIIASISVDKSNTFNSDTLVVTVEVTDPENDELSLTWSFSHGTFEEIDTRTVRWYTPNEPTIAQVEVTASDGENSVDFLRSFTLSQKPLIVYWEQVGTLPSVMDISRSAAVFQIGDAAFIGTGRTIDNSSKNSEFWKYDLTDHSWTRLGDYPGPFSQSSSLNHFVIGDKGYTISGCCDGSWETFYQYDPASDTWTKLDDFPGYHILGATSFVIDTKAYVIDNNKNTWEFNSTNMTWTQKQDFPGENLSQRVFSGAINGFGFAAETNTRNVFKYDPQQDSWSQVADYPSAAVGWVKTTEYNNTILAAFGFDPFDTSNTVEPDDVWLYDPVEDAWGSAPPFPGTGEIDPTLFVYEDLVYVMHGSPANNEIWRLQKNQ